MRRWLIAALLALYFAFIALDCFLPERWQLSAVVKGVSISGCFALTALSLRGGKTGVFNLIAAGLTCAADMLLLYTELFALGIAVFIAAQACRLDSFSRPSRHFAPLAAAGGYALAGVLWLCGMEPISATAMPYALLLVSVFGMAVRGIFRFPERRRGYILLTLGAALFILCDICVAAFNLLPEGSALSRPAGVLMWVFYLPSQTIFALYGGD